MAGRVENKIIIITGASRGIGAETARLLVAEGAHVVLADLRDTEGRALAAELGDSATFVSLDVRSESQWASAVGACHDVFGSPDVLVNNAGVMVAGTIEAATADQFRTAFEVNALGAFLGIKAVLASMREAGGGAIVNVASASGLEGTPGIPLYAASKAANINLTRSAAMELGRDSIRVNGVVPGLTETKMSTGPEFDGWDRNPWCRSLPLGREGQVSDIAPAILFLASDESRYMTGSLVSVDGGQLAGHVAL